MRLVPLKFFTAEIKEFIHSKVLHGFPPPSNPQFNILLKYQSLMIHSSELKKKKEILTLSLDLNINKTKKHSWWWLKVKSYQGMSFRRSVCQTESPDQNHKKKHINPTLLWCCSKAQGNFYSICIFGFFSGHLFIFYWVIKAK